MVIVLIHRIFSLWNFLMNKSLARFFHVLALIFLQKNMALSIKRKQYYLIPEYPEKRKIVTWKYISNEFLQGKTWKLFLLIVLWRVSLNLSFYWLIVLIKVCVCEKYLTCFYIHVSFNHYAFRLKISNIVHFKNSCKIWMILAFNKKRNSSSFC